MIAAAKYNRLCIFSIALLALLLQSMIPSGFMPSFKKDAPFKIEICTASGLATIAVDAQKTPFSKKQRMGGHTSCPYAQVLSHALTGQQGSVQIILPRGAALIRFPAFLLHRFLTKDWLSQGPPASLRI
jgi:hypothetical protein